ncbi:unnamed protein product [Heterobilharzia americana]|nr:unnamed protein product [Heterobilharzia americana]
MDCAVSHNLSNEETINDVKPSLDSSVFSGQKSNSKLPSCAVSLACATPIMTITNATPEIPHTKTFYSSTSRPHNQLSVHYNHEMNDTIQLKPQIQSFITINGDNANKSMEEPKLVDPQPIILSSSPPGSSSVNTSVDGGIASDDFNSSIDSELTACKIQQLQHDVTQLETAIKNNLNEQQELNDRLFLQLAEVPKVENEISECSSSSSPSHDQSASSESEIKRIYSEKLKLLKKQLKALNEQLQTTRYVIGKLEIYGIPFGVSPKDYVKQFINSRHKSCASCATASPSSKPKTTLPSSSDTNHQLFPCSSSSIGSSPNENVTSLSSAPDVCRSHQLAKTLPARISNPNIDSYKQPTRQANTLPAKSIHENKTSNFDPLFMPTQFSISGQYCNNSDLQPIPSSQFSSTAQLSCKHELTGPIMSTTSCISNRNLLTSHPTAPHFYPHFSNEHPVYDDHTLKVITSPNTGVLNTVRTGLGSFGRQLFRVGKPRSHSDENIPMKTNGISNDDSGYRKKGTSRPAGYSLFAPSEKKKSKKITKSHLAVSNLLYPPNSSNIFLSENLTSSNSQPIRTGSLSSTNGVNPIGTGYDGGGRSMISGLSGIGGVGAAVGGASKDDINPDPSGNTGNIGGFNSWSESGDNTLMRIFEFLGVSGSQVYSNGQNLISSGNNNMPGVGSSGSSALSASGLGILDKSKAGSKSHISGANIIPSDTFNTPYSAMTGGIGINSSRPDCTLTTVSPNNLALAFAYLYRRQECLFTLLTNQQSQIFQELRDELAVMRSETLNIQSSLNNLTTELEAIRRDATTKAELQNQKLIDASSRIERLDAIAEESRQALPHELTTLRNEFHDSLYSVEYQVTTKIRDLSDNITSINNKVSMIEKPNDQSSTLGSHGTELERVRRKVLHYLTDLCVSFFALVTMLLQVLIRCLNLGAVLTENRKLAVCFSMTMLASCLLVYTSDPIITWLREDDITENPGTVRHRTQYWRSILIAILSFFRSFSRGMS